MPGTNWPASKSGAGGSRRGAWCRRSRCRRSATVIPAPPGGSGGDQPVPGLARPGSRPGLPRKLHWSAAQPPGVPAVPWSSGVSAARAIQFGAANATAGVALERVRSPRPTAVPGGELEHLRAAVLEPDHDLAGDEAASACAEGWPAAGTRTRRRPSRRRRGAIAPPSARGRTACTLGRARPLHRAAESVALALATRQDCRSFRSPILQPMADSALSAARRAFHAPRAASRRAAPRRTATCRSAPSSSATGEVLAAAGNERELRADPTAHAEILALRAAAEAVGGWRLPGRDPLRDARAVRDVRGGDRPRAGAAGRLRGRRPEGGRGRQRPRRARRAAPQPPPEVESGLLAEESAALLRDFFAERRG